LLSKLRKDLSRNVPTSARLLARLQRLRDPDNSRFALCVAITAAKPSVSCSAVTVLGRANAGACVLSSSALALGLPLLAGENAGLMPFMLPSSGFFIAFPWRFCHRPDREKWTGHRTLRGSPSPRSSDGIVVLYIFAFIGLLDRFEQIVCLNSAPLSTVSSRRPDKHDLQALSPAAAKAAP